MPFGDFAAVLDDFNRADEGPPPSGNWVPGPVFGSPFGEGLYVVSNQCAGFNAGANDNVWVEELFGPDCEVYCDVPTLPSPPDSLRLYVRLIENDVGEAPGGDGYLLQFFDSFGSTTWTLMRLDAAVETQIGSPVTNPLSAGDSIGVEAIGSTLKGYRKNAGTWAEIISATDSTYSGAGYVGAVLNGTTARIDNFSAGPPSPFKRTKMKIARTGKQGRSYA